MLQAVATPLAQAIEIARLSEEDRKRMEQLAVLNRVSRAIGSTTDLDEMLTRAVEAIRETHTDGTMPETWTYNQGNEHLRSCLVTHV